MERYGERFLHIDMDAFFVEVERRRDPSLIGKPVVVGGLGPRGVVASASYEARRHGVHSAMPIVEARRLCPHGRFVAPSHGVYGEVSEEVFAIFRSFTPLVEGLSVDEAFLEISGLRLHFATPGDVGSALRAKVREELGLPASVGISAVKFISKLASEEAKPDGMHIVPAGTELEFLHPMPVRRLWGVGEATRVTLDALGVATIGDLTGVPESLLVKRLGPSLARHLSRLAMGVDPREVEPGTGAKSISVEETYDVDLSDDDEIRQSVLRLCDRLATRLHRSGHLGKVVSLKVRFGDFETVSRSETMPTEVGSATAIWDEAQRLLNRVDRRGRGVRLLGVGVAGLADAGEPHQLALGEGPREAAADVVETVRDRFGDDAVLRASFIPRTDQKRRDR
ncbi:MAG: DNA polymerase IV [Acidimicrobiia bacterium]|nr:DNA polymerase IV [Acidimicrobiia bacterium]